MVIKASFKLDHIGIAVEDLIPAVDNYKKFFPCTVSSKEVLPEQSVEIIFVTIPGSRLELIAPMKLDQKPAGTASIKISPIEKFLAKRGSGLHHICYLVPDILSELANFKQQGATLIDEVPRLGAEGKKIAFVSPKTFNGVLIELAQE